MQFPWVHRRNLERAINDVAFWKEMYQSRGKLIDTSIANGAEYVDEIIRLTKQLDSLRAEANTMHGHLIAHHDPIANRLGPYTCVLQELKN